MWEIVHTVARVEKQYGKSNVRAMVWQCYFENEILFLKTKSLMKHIMHILDLSYLKNNQNANGRLCTSKLQIYQRTNINLHYSK